MAIYPGAIQRIIENKRFSRGGATIQRVNLHVDAGNADSLFGYFSPAGRACSHFHVKKSGVVEQYIDTAYKSQADLNGNSSTVSIETQGYGHEAWTAEQLAALVALWAWLRDTHGIANKLASDSVPGHSSKGLSWHRLGVPGYMNPNGIKYSNARGKVCPGDARIAQIPEIFARANGQVATPTAPPSTPSTPRPPVRTYSRGGLTKARYASLQKFLNEKFGESLGVDGIPGPASDGAIRRFQERATAEGHYTAGVDGIPGPGTQAAARVYGWESNGALPAPAFPLPIGWYFGPKSGPKQSVSGYYPDSGTSNSYSRRAALKQWQQRMKDRGWNIDPDGLYGPNTAAVTVAFQKEKGLTVDAAIGPETWAAAWTAPIT